MKQRVGFMGLGIMGIPMAANVAKAGYPLIVYNRTPDKAAGLIAAGAGVAPTPKALAEASDVIIAMVTGPEAIADLLFGADGAAEAFSDKKVFINMSSVPPLFTKELHARLVPTGVGFIDAPVSGSKKPAEDATLLILAGGDRKTVEACTPLLETMGKKVIYCGEAGQGSMMKMANNLLLAGFLEATAEAVNFGVKGGLSMETLFDVILSGPMNCPIVQMKKGSFEKGEYPPNFPLKHMTKDLKFLVDTGYQTGAPTPVGNTLLHLFRTGVGQGWGDLDVAGIMKVLEFLNGKE